MSGHERTVDSDVVVDLAVPSADSAANVTIPDVVGNKSDTVAGNSVVSLVKVGTANNLTLHTAPGTNSVSNSSIRDVVGSKNDTIGGTSLISLAKLIKVKTDNLPSDPADESNILGKLTTPTKNSVDDADMRDVIGRKTDDEDGTSLYSLAYTMSKHMHGIQLCKPKLAGGLNVISGAGAWGLSASYVVLFATNEVTSPFDIHQIHVGSFSANDIYQLELYSGANGAEVLISQVRFSRTSNTNPGSILPCITPIIPANTQVKARLASAGGGTNVNFSVMYHVY